MCVCVSVPPEISLMGDHVAMLLTLSQSTLPGEVHKLLFQPTQWTVPEKKPLQFFHQSHSKSHVQTATLPVTLGGINPVHNFNSVTMSFSNSMMWASYHGQDQEHTLCIMGTILAIALYVNDL